MLRQRELRRVQHEAAAARVFQPPSPNQSFKYLYIPTKARIPVGTLRTTFRRLGVNNARLLDIHYPTSHTAAILVHNDYENEFIELLAKHRITPKANFNPNSGSILEDPNLASLSPLLNVAKLLKNTKLHALNVQYNISVLQSSMLCCRTASDHNGH